jgi:selT/selW/selH-like putative selenoprotein
LGDELKKELDAEIELIAGGGGIFDISVDGNMVFSKFKKGHFPQPEEIVGLIKSG